MTTELTVAGRVDDHVAELELLSDQIQGTQDRVDRERTPIRADVADLLRALGGVQAVMADIKAVRERWPNL